MTANHSAPDERHPRLRGFYVAACALLFGLYTFQLWFHATHASVTIDEPTHILAGHWCWRCGDYSISPEHPPLLRLLAAAPLNFRTFVEPNWGCGARLQPADGDRPQLQGGEEPAGIMFLAENNPEDVVIRARAAAASLSLLLAGLVFVATRQMFGRWEGLTALTLLAFEPNLIAHGSLVTTDMALAATAFAAVYAVYRYTKSANIPNVLLAGLALGLMLAAKHSAVIFVPILLTLLLADVVLFRRNGAGAPKQLLRQASACAVLLLIGLLVLWAFYSFRYQAVPGATTSTVNVADYIRAMGRPETVESPAAKFVTGLSRTRILPEAYVLGLANIVATGSRNAFIFDRSYPTGQWFYFPLAFIVKSSVALLLLLPLGLLFPLFGRARRRETMFLLAPPLLFFAVSLTSRINIGVRHILPVYPFFIVAAAVGAVAVCRRFHLARYVLLALLLFHAATAARTAPNYIAFANDFWGGTNNTYRVFRDSNVEWGQNLKLVRAYLAREHINDCWFASYGGGELSRLYQPCRLLPALAWQSGERLVEPVPPIIEGTVLLSVTVLPPRGGAEYLPVARTPSVAEIGGSVLVYRGRFAVPLVAALSHTARAEQLMLLNHFAEAAADAREAVKLAPDDPRTHLSLATALARAGQTGEARREFETTVRLAGANLALFRDLELRARQELKRFD